MTPEPDAHQGSSGSPSFSVIDGQTGGQAYEDRLMAIHAIRADGLTLQVIGDTFGITRERVRQLLVMSNGPSAEHVRKFRREQHDAEVELANSVCSTGYMRTRDRLCRRRERLSRGQRPSWLRRSRWMRTAWPSSGAMEVPTVSTVMKRRWRRCDMRGD